MEKKNRKSSRTLRLTKGRNESEEKEAVKGRKKKK